MHIHDSSTTVLVIGTLGTSLLLDPVDSYSRARLVCVLLDSCGQYFEHGSSKKKLDNFLVFFQVISPAIMCLII